MTQTQSHREFAETFRELCDELELEPHWGAEELFCLEPRPASRCPRILISFAPGYWRTYAQRSGAAKAQARSAVLQLLTRKVTALQELGKDEVYAIRAVMTGGI